ncbi:hypothetical protein [Cellulomonas carbonis]|uniref:hypothetical protein n=1 Tax=Cellulomonas carbonis TaxID=1386092 RepID=UPI000B291C18|nr:hypothetical protein [Cellulomonas carbonis]MDT0164396.1 hypothetical protein [Actinotalea sp. AC32]GGB95624.1 hypothetical protein GCM10010972_05440 [Cellulomonas carbonis]
MSHHDAHHDDTTGATPQPGGGREDATGTGSLGDTVADPSHAAHPTDGAPSPGPQPGSTSPLPGPDADDPDREGDDRFDAG